jgi:very-short-patch-repair endonuclease
MTLTKVGRKIIYKNKKYLKKYRSQLRNNMTPAEAQLWKILRKKHLNGRKFRRQFSIGDFILDFYCPSEKLGIELDGNPHFNVVALQKDYYRDIILKNQGIRILRFENKLVFENQELIIEAIISNFNQ